MFNEIGDIHVFLVTREIFKSYRLGTSLGW